MRTSRSHRGSRNKRHQRALVSEEEALQRATFAQVAKRREQRELTFSLHLWNTPVRDAESGLAWAGWSVGLRSSAENRGWRADQAGCRQAPEPRTVAGDDGTCSVRSNRNLSAQELSASASFPMAAWPLSDTRRASAAGDDAQDREVGSPERSPTTISLRRYGSRSIRYESVNAPPVVMQLSPDGHRMGTQGCY